MGWPKVVCYQFMIQGRFKVETFILLYYLMQCNAASPLYLPAHPQGNLRESEKGIEIKAQSVSTFIGMVPPSVHQKYNQR